MKNLVLSKGETINMIKSIFKRRKMISIIMIFCFAVLNFGGCAREYKKDNELVFGTTLSISSLDPAKDYNGWFTVRYGVSETLFKFDDNMNPVPNLALSYENIDDTTWKININESILFQNNEYMSAERVKSSIERSLNINERISSTLKISNIVVEGSNLIIETSESNPTLINDLCDPAVSIINVEDTKDFDNNPIGTGPFKVESFNPIKSSIFKRFDGYFKGTPYLDSIKVINVSDSDTLTMALQTGEIDVAQGINYSSLSLFKDDEDYKIESIDTSRAIVLYYNFKNSILNDESARKAINLSIDKDKYVSSLLNETAVPAIGAFPSSISYGDSNLEEDSMNIEKAKEILNKSGYIDSNNDGILDKNGQNLTLSLITYSSRSELPVVAQAIQDDLKKIGIEVNIEICGSVTNMMEKLNNGSFDLALYSNITCASGDSAAYLTNLMGSSGASNYGKYSNLKIDSLLKTLNAEFDADKRSSLAVEIQQESLKDNAFNFIAHLKVYFVMQENIEDFSVHPTDYYEFNYKTKMQN